MRDSRSSRYCGKCPVVLPLFRGFTVDLRLKQFRKVTTEGLLFIDFSTPEGDRLLSAYIRGMRKDSEEFRRLLQVL